ncbi:MAG: phosphatase PAP2 family protein [Chitinophagales bacterium]|nr:phosphatase PAP2 family protein [Chitinophagales bacterium]
MLEMLQQLDVRLFQWINTGLANPVFDVLLPWCREKWFWAPVYWFIAAFSLINYGKKGWIIILGLVLAAGVADFTSSTLIKKNVQRLRPCNDPQRVEQIILRVPCGSGYSFTSSHAANHFAAAVFMIGVFGRFRKWIKPMALSWAASIAISQVYVGVHYPGDVSAGALLGILLGWGVYLAMRKWLPEPLV